MKRKSYFKVVDSDEKSSTDESKPPSKEEEDNSAADYGYQPLIGIGEEAQSEYEEAYKPNHYDYETKHKSEHQSSNWKAGMPSSPNGTGFLKSPVYTADQPHSIQKPDPCWMGVEQHAQPLIRAAWAGDFSVYCNREKISATFGGIKGCVSSKACAAARSVVEQLPPSISWEKLPRWSVWPKSFECRGGPTDDDIAVFFFPSVTKHEGVYESLVFDLIRDDMALRTSVMGPELLLFTSVELPPLFTRFQAKLYLWGVFRGNRPPL